MLLRRLRPVCAWGEIHEQDGRPLRLFSRLFWPRPHVACHRLSFAHLAKRGSVGWTPLGSIFFFRGCLALPGPGLWVSSPVPDGPSDTLKFPTPATLGTDIGGVDADTFGLSPDKSGAPADRWPSGSWAVGAATPLGRDAVTWRERRLQMALDELVEIDAVRFDELVPGEGRAGLDAFRVVVEKTRQYFRTAVPTRDPAGLTNAAFTGKTGSPALQPRTVERAFDGFHLALTNLGVPLRVDRRRSPAEVVDVEGAWSGEWPTPFRWRLRPEALPQIERKSLGERFRALLIEPRDKSPRLIALVGAAGMGKTTVLGQITDAASKSGINWTCGVFCEDFLPETTPEIFLATALLGTSGTMREVLPELATHPRGLLLLDTVDLVLSDETVAAWAEAVRVIAKQTTVVFSCREWEWRYVLEPRLREAVVVPVPPFSPVEVEEATCAYCERNGVPYKPFVGQVTRLLGVDRRLDRIVKNPLLLSIICRLFGPAGTVPGDLTVLRLYEELVARRIRRTRRGTGPDDPRSIAKEEICFRFAREVVSRSSLNIQEVLRREVFAGLDPIAFRELRSDGILEELGGLRVQFFHQTFLEYMVGAWLTTEPEAAREFLGRLKAAPSVPYLAAALLRMYLAQLPDDSERHEVSLGLPLGELSVFHAVALAWAAHGRPDELFADLADRAEQGEQALQDALVEALEAARLPWSPRVLDRVLMMVERFAPTVVRALIPILVEGTTAAPRERWDEIATTLTSTLSKRSVSDIDLLSTYAAELGRRGDEAGAQSLAVVASAFDKLGSGGERAVVAAMAKMSDPTARKEFFAQLLKRPVDGAWYEVATELVFAVQRDRATDRGSSDAAWLDLVRHPLPGTWEVHGYRALGRFLVDGSKPDLVTALVRAVATGPKPEIGPALVVLAEAVSSGMPQECVREALSGVPLDASERAQALAELQGLANQSTATSSPRPSGRTGRRSQNALPAPPHEDELPELVEQALRPEKKCALGAARKLASASDAGICRTADLERLFVAPIPGVRVVAFQALERRVQSGGVEVAAFSKLMEKVIEVALRETTSTTFVEALELLHALIVKGTLPDGALQTLGTLIVKLKESWIDGGCVLRVARFLEVVVARSSDADREALWPMVAPWLLRSDLGKFHNVEKHLVPAFRFLLRSVSSAITAAVENASDPIPSGNLRALYLAALNECPASPLVGVLLQREPSLRTVRPIVS